MAKNKHAGESEKPPLSDLKASRLCAEYFQVDDERMERNRLNEASNRRLKDIRAELLPWLQSTRGKLPVRDLKRFTVSLVEKPNSFSAMGELEKEIGAEEVARRKSLVGTRPEVLITEKVKPARAAAKRNPKAA